MVVKHDVALENLKPLVAHCLSKAIQLLDSELRKFVFGETKTYSLTNIFEDGNKFNFALKSEVISSLIQLYSKVGWTVEQMSDDAEGNVVLSFK